MPGSLIVLGKSDCLPCTGRARGAGSARDRTVAVGHGRGNGSRCGDARSHRTGTDTAYTSTRRRSSACCAARCARTCSTASSATRRATAGRAATSTVGPRSLAKCRKRKGYADNHGNYFPKHFIPA